MSSEVNNGRSFRNNKTVFASVVRNAFVTRVAVDVIRLLLLNRPRRHDLRLLLLIIATVLPLGLLLSPGTVLLLLLVAWLRLLAPRALLLLLVSRLRLLLAPRSLLLT
jgi:hypothetical protein